MALHRAKSLYTLASAITTLTLQLHLQYNMPPKAFSFYTMSQDNLKSDSKIVETTTVKPLPPQEKRFGYIDPKSSHFILELSVPFGSATSSFSPHFVAF